MNFTLSFILLVFLFPSTTDRDEEERIQTRRGQCDLGSTKFDNSLVHSSNIYEGIDILRSIDRM